MKRLMTCLTCLCLLLTVPAVSHASSLIPRRNCSATSSQLNHQVISLASINFCRAKQGIKPMVLPTNWDRLTPPQQNLVIVNLERTARGLSPVVGLTSDLNADAASGIQKRTDPVAPLSRVDWYASDWSGDAGSIQNGQGLIVSDFIWMYNDGWWTHGAVHSLNEECTSANNQNCWGHTRVLLTQKNGPIVMGASASNVNGSYDFILSSDSGQHVIWSWAQEKKFLQKG